MYQIFKNVIESRNYELNIMLAKIDTIWVQGKLSDEERTELIGLARANADPAVSLNILETLNNHEDRIRALEENKPAPEQPDGGFEPGKIYRKGDIVTWNGKKWECTLNEYTDSTTFTPDVYPAYWTELK